MALFFQETPRRFSSVPTHFSGSAAGHGNQMLSRDQPDRPHTPAAGMIVRGMVLILACSMPSILMAGAGSPIRNAGDTTFGANPNGFTGDNGAEWVGRYASGGTYRDVSGPVVIDAGNNAVVIGTSIRSDSREDVVTLKYDSAGSLLWTRYYDGGYDDHAVDVAPDGSGGAIVTGISYSNARISRIVTLRYSADGDLLWKAEIEDSTGLNLIAEGLAIDSTGRIYVLGTVDGPYPRQNVLARYDLSGAAVWMRRQQFTTWGLSPRVVAADHAGDIVISGGSAAAKYDSLGVLKWTISPMSEITSMALDDSDNIVFTAAGDLPFVRGYRVAKYGPSGNMAWDTTVGIDGYTSNPQAVVCAFDQSIIVSGPGTQTMRFTGSGHLLWKKYRWSGGDHIALAVDSIGTVYVAGLNPDGLELAQFGPTGTNTWVRSFGIPGSQHIPGGLAIDRNNRPTLSATLNLQPPPGWGLWLTALATLRYTWEGDTVWTRFAPPSNSKDFLVDVASDNEGGVVATGMSLIGSTAFSAATVKYGAGGGTEWVARYSAGGDTGVVPVEIATDSEGSVVVVAGTWQVGWERDILTIKYDRTGHQEWVRRFDTYDHRGNLPDVPKAVVADRDGSIIVAGICWSSEVGHTDLVTMKYSPSGESLWARKFDLNNSETLSAVGLAVDDSGNIVVCCFTYVGPGNTDFVVVKYDPTGTERWARYYDGPIHSYEYAKSVATDREGNVIVAGESYGVSGLQSVVLKYSPGGDLIWAVRGDESPSVLKALPDDSGNVYLAGGGRVMSTVKYDGAGNQAWVRKDSLLTGRSGWFSVTDMMISPEQRIFVTGYNNAVGSTAGILTVGYDPDGTPMERWHDEAGSDLEVGSPDLAAGPGGSVYVGGSVGMETTWRNYVVFGYPGTINPVSEEQVTVPEGYTLYQNYPNPFNPVTTIRYGLPRAVHVTLAVYNMLGEEVAILVDEVQEPGTRSVSIDAAELPSGVYAYRLTAGTFTDVKKMVFIK